MNILSTIGRAARTGADPTFDAARAAIYLPAVLSRIPSLLSQLDREDHSRSYGSFDRDQWAWKFRDFPLGMLQVASYPLAVLWRTPAQENPYARNPRLLSWIDGAIGQTLRRQRRNGAFDTFAPNEQDPGPTLGVAHGLCETLRHAGDALGAARVDEIREAIGRACDFALHRDEQHGFISNHQALFACAFQSAHEVLGDGRYGARAEQIIDGIIERQSPDGWYNEYGGPDPGYETLGIFHLAMYWQRTGSERLLKSLTRSVEFLAHCVHPDGSIGGNYGSRHTSLYFPGGLEILSGRVPLAAAVAQFMAARLHRANVVTPAQVDAENLAPLAYSYLEACLVADPPLDAPTLPCESLHGIRLFDDSRVAVAGTGHYYAVIHGGRGGMARVHSRETEDVVFEDAGYVVSGPSRTWASQLAGDVSARAALSGNELVCSTRLSVVAQELLTPSRFLILRLLNLTLFHNARLGSWFRRHVVARLITARRIGPLTLRRTVRLEEDAVHFSDRLDLAAQVPIERVDLPRSFTAIHMGSAKYFHPAELLEITSPDLGRMAARLRESASATNSFSVTFGEAAGSTESESPALDRFPVPSTSGYMR